MNYVANMGLHVANIVATDPILEGTLNNNSLSTLI